MEEKISNEGKWEVGYKKEIFKAYPEIISHEIHSVGTVPPKSNLKGLVKHWKEDLKSGFIIFLIALPLCLGIALASGVPAIAGIISAIVGGMIVSLLSGSHLTIMGPAAGLIVVILGAVETLGHGDPVLGYQAMLSAVVISGIVLILFGFIGAGVLGDFFPASVIHGMMAAIGIIIISKQIHVALGVKPTTSEPIHLLLEIPHSIMTMNVPIALIGIGSLLIVMYFTFTKNPILKQVPAPMMVVVLALITSWLMDLEHEHEIVLLGNHFHVGQRDLISIPDNLLEGITFPDWSQITTGSFWIIVFTITFVQGLESMLAAIAVDKLDPYHRHSNLNKDLRAIGMGNIISGMLGGLPMIAEIVRSSANVNAGAKTRWSNFFHGFFMLFFVALFPHIIHRIPTAALAALLIFSGYRLASPENFIHAWKVGKGQLLVFLSTTIITVATDLLIGVFVGTIINFLVDMYEGKAQLKDLFILHFKILDNKDGIYKVQVKRALVFTNFLVLKSKLKKLPHHSVIELDMSQTYIIDHTVFENLEPLKEELKSENKILVTKGLEKLSPISKYTTATRVRNQ
jgi:MFS superfamily sulfate permease-like transporter